MSFSTGLFSEDVNHDCTLKVETIIQQSLDDGCFIDKMSSKSIVKNLAYLRKPAKVSETTFVLDELKLFNHLISIADRELSLLEGLAYELIQLPLSLFNHKQRMRTPNKTARAKHLKGYVNVTKSLVA